MKKMRVKRRKFIFYSIEADAIFEVGRRAVLDLTFLMIRHEFGFNRTMIYLGEL